MRAQRDFGFASIECVLSPRAWGFFTVISPRSSQLGNFRQKGHSHLFDPILTT